MPRPAKVPAALLVEDWNFYPRAHVDSAHVTGMIEAMAAGVELPPVIADRESRRLVDGFHRRQAALKARGPTAEIEVFWRSYDSDAAMFEEAVRLNASHGRKLTRWDHARIKLRAEELGISVTRIAAVIHRNPDYVERKLHVAIRELPGGKEEPVALKRTMQRFEGQVLTAEQQEVNAHASGWSFGFHVNQVIAQLEVGGIEITDDLRDRLCHLRELISDVT